MIGSKEAEGLDYYSYKTIFWTRMGDAWRTYVEAHPERAEFVKQRLRIATGQLEFWTNGGKGDPPPSGDEPHEPAVERGPQSAFQRSVVSVLARPKVSKRVQGTTKAVQLPPVRKPKAPRKGR